VHRALGEAAEQQQRQGEHHRDGHDR
jgi:hypothetical protein